MFVLGLIKIPFGFTLLPSLQSDVDLALPNLVTCSDLALST